MTLLRSKLLDLNHRQMLNGPEDGIIWLALLGTLTLLLPSKLS